MGRCSNHQELAHQLVSQMLIRWWQHSRPLLPSIYLQRPLEREFRCSELVGKLACALFTINKSASKFALALPNLKSFTLISKTVEHLRWHRHLHQPQLMMVRLSRGQTIQRLYNWSLEPQLIQCRSNKLGSVFFLLTCPTWHNFLRAYRAGYRHRQQPEGIFAFFLFYFFFFDIFFLQFIVTCNLQESN